VGIAYFAEVSVGALDRSRGLAGVQAAWTSARMMMFAQIVVGLALATMGGTGTKAGLGRLGAFALIVAFASATQDIVVDAWRIESASDGEEQAPRLCLISSATGWRSFVPIPLSSSWLQPSAGACPTVSTAHVWPSE